jgi:hypothetical protein
VGVLSSRSGFWCGGSVTCRRHIRPQEIDDVVAGNAGLAGQPLSGDAVGVGSTAGWRWGNVPSWATS